MSLNMVIDCISVNGAFVSIPPVTLLDKSSLVINREGEEFTVSVHIAPTKEEIDQAISNKVFDKPVDESVISGLKEFMETGT